MTRRGWAALLPGFLALVAPPFAAEGKRPLAGLRTWVAYYGQGPEAAADLARFDLVVLNPGNPPPLPRVKQLGALVLMYVSLAEVNVNHPAYAPVAREPWVLDANPNWPEARRLDVRASGYERWLLERVVRAALAGPVDGVFLDTADTALHLEATNPGRFRAMGAALERTLRALRAAHPRAFVVINGGLPLVERAPDLVDAFAVESVWTDYDFAARSYRRRPEAEAAAKAARLQTLAARGLPVFTLEYARPDQTEWVHRLITLARSHGFVPYVATIGLDRVFGHTLER